MGILFFIIVVLALALLLLARLKPKAPSGAMPYVRKERLLSPAERSFYGVLQQTFGHQYEIFAHVRIADLLGVKKGQAKGGWQSAFNRISAKHMDFVLCRPDDLHIVACIELDDISHNAAKRIERDDLINRAFQAVGLPLLRIKAQASYSGSAIAMQLEQELGIKQPAIQLPRLAAAHSAGEQPPTLCPKCSAVMVRKQATKGKYAGAHFMACTGYPACKTIIPIKVGQQAETAI